MSINKTDVVGEYLHEVERRISGLPLLQRRELLADLETHIATARAERGVSSDGELIEILERLGSPEIVAAAAYQEAGAVPPVGGPPPIPPPVAVAARPQTPRWVLWAIVAAATIGMGVLLLIGFAALALGSSSSVEEEPAPAVVREAPQPPDVLPPTPR